MGKCGSKIRRNDFDNNNLGSFNKLLKFILNNQKCYALFFIEKSADIAQEFGNN